MFGGGLRGIYTSGIFDYLLDNKIYIPYCLGISAGSANVASYVSKQKGRNKKFYEEYSFEKEYMSVRNLIKKGSFIDLDYIYRTLSNENGKSPWNYDAAMKSDQEMVVQISNAKTAKPEYIYKKDFTKNDYWYFCASSCIPIVCKPYKHNNNYYYDGGIIDPIPFKKAFEDGCTKVIVLLTRPISCKRKLENDAKFYKALKNKYPDLMKAMYNRPEVYNKQIEEIKEKYELSGEILVIAPDDVCGMKTLTKDKTKMELLYNKGYKDGEKIKLYLENIGSG